MRRSPLTKWLLCCTLATGSVGHAWAQCSALSDPTSPECNQGSRSLSGALPAVTLPMPEATAAPEAPAAGIAGAAALLQAVPSISIHKTHNHYTLPPQEVQQLHHLQNSAHQAYLQQMQAIQAAQGLPPGISAQDYQRALNSGVQAATMGMQTQAEVLQRMGIMHGLLNGK